MFGRNAVDRGRRKPGDGIPGYVGGGQHPIDRGSIGGRLIILRSLAQPGRTILHRVEKADDLARQSSSPSRGPDRFARSAFRARPAPGAPSERHAIESRHGPFSSGCCCIGAAWACFAAEAVPVPEAAAAAPRQSLKRRERTSLLQPCSHSSHRGSLHHSLAPKLLRQLGVRDAALIVMGGIVGSGIFMNPSVVARFVQQRRPGDGAFGWPAESSHCWAPASSPSWRRDALTTAACMRTCATRFIRRSHSSSDGALLLVSQSGGMAAAAVTFANYFGH